ncbi:MAG TPA: S-adenosylmethionine:tRNA ribosyltransferase-isomerase [Salinivirgaceae bacterium]|nr:S-adenosylmethionine:tRNA ribosyltransferase-isomerase [Salinivirgaceae bacterium]
MKIPSIDISNYDYPLPEERIAQYPLQYRDRSKLLVYQKGKISEHVFQNIKDLLPSDSLLVMNNTRVIAARLYFKKETGATIEVFCLEPVIPNDYALVFSTRSHCRWKCLVGNLKKWRNGRIGFEMFLGGDKVRVEAQQVERQTDAVIVDFHWNGDYSFSEILQHAGELPLPPYLNRKSEERDRLTYQTVYGKIDGSVAAPTAGLHFTDEIFDMLHKNGIETAEITLHVGAGTFKPVKSDNIAEHTMHSEVLSVSRRVIQQMYDHHNNITAVGTTTVRTLESLYYIANKIYQQKIKEPKQFFVEQWEPYGNNSLLTSQQALEVLLEYLENTNQEHIYGSTALLIMPGFQLRYINRLVTNFHQPRSTLLLLVSAFVGDDWRKIYNYALENNFRFLSYGDSCLILR